MRRLLVSSLLAIALLFLGSVVLLYRFGGGARRPSPDVTSAAQPPAAPGGAPVTQPGFAPVRDAAAPAAQRSVPEAALHRVATTHELMPPSRRHSLASFRREAMRGLAALEGRIARCASKGAAAPLDPALEPASFTLGVETVAGGIRISEVRLESRGAASDAVVACAIAALRGHVIPASSAEPGRSWQLRFSPGARAGQGAVPPGP